MNQKKNSIEERYTNGLKQEKQKTYSENARDNILRFYRKHKNICNVAFEYYQEYERHKDKYVMEPQRIDNQQFLEKLDAHKILVLTANPVECGVLIRRLSEKQSAPLETYMVGNYSYNVFHVQNNKRKNNSKKCIIHLNPGKTGEEHTRDAINSACSIFIPDCICGLGICYGFNMARNSIGNVFLSESLTTFRINYRDMMEQEAEGEGIKIEAETEYEKRPIHSLVQSVRELLLYTMVQNFLSPLNEPMSVTAELGKFLSINSLMSNKTAKQALLDQYGKIKPKPLGGEMEGSGILKSDIVKQQEYSRWLIVKGVCDWGEMKNELDPNKAKNDKIKDSLQAFAMSSSCSVFEKILSELWEA